MMTNLALAQDQSWKKEFAEELQGIEDFQRTYIYDARLSEAIDNSDNILIRDKLSEALLKGRMLIAEEARIALQTAEKGKRGKQLKTEKMKQLSEPKYAKLTDTDLWTMYKYGQFSGNSSRVRTAALEILNRYQRQEQERDIDATEEAAKRRKQDIISIKEDAITFGLCDVLNKIAEGSFEEAIVTEDDWFSVLKQRLGKSQQNILQNHSVQRKEMLLEEGKNGYEGRGKKLVMILREDSKRDLSRPTGCADLYDRLLLGARDYEILASGTASKETISDLVKEEIKGSQTIDEARKRICNQYDSLQPYTDMQTVLKGVKKAIGTIDSALQNVNAALDSKVYESFVGHVWNAYNTVEELLRRKAADETISVTDFRELSKYIWNYFIEELLTTDVDEAASHAQSIQDALVRADKTDTASVEKIVYAGHEIFKFIEGYTHRTDKVVRQVFEICANTNNDNIDYVLDQLEAYTFPLSGRNTSQSERESYTEAVTKQIGSTDDKAEASERASRFAYHIEDMLGEGLTMNEALRQAEELETNMAIGTVQLEGEGRSVEYIMEAQPPSGYTMTLKLQR